MNIPRTTLIWFLVAGVLGGLIYLFKPMLTPFIIGIIIAYLLDPIVGMIDHHTGQRISRSICAITVVVAFFAVLTVFGVLVGPLLWSQAAEFAHNLPEYHQAIMSLIVKSKPMLAQYIDANTIDRLGETINTAAGDFVGSSSDMIKPVLTKGLAVFDILSVIMIAPIVSFYMIRDWGKTISWIDAHLPREVAPTVRKLCGDIDSTLSAFFRGQGLLACALAVYYATALSFTGLTYGAVIGLVTGILSFIPFVGFASGLVVATIMTAIQFHDGIHVLWVLGIFGIAQILDAAFLSPKLVGERIGLHPVWVIFALFGGGTVAGFVGVLLAVPAAASIGVLCKYLVSQYRTSDLYAKNT